MKGSNSRTKVGTYDSDKIIGKEKGKFKFFRNSISSNKFKIIPSDKKIRTVIKKILQNFEIKYLLIILFIL